ncbi:EF-P lysine aminoacylase GenX [Desulfopila sp. IMCC35006]|uniref:EF-P lysine aminoacylase EpmA n=1 Tax=Desulfopila sp. IMCC35006 TaxID=2569542 RepID=UPI0010AC4593|nr:EF-P lysine aminoacylase EpmA [Desulfopila sp. IMCC35006]TKB24924.1 EF-P lysine aminoacylase GenX [Desulfopila sp. IMCC35006]
MLDRKRLHLRAAFFRFIRSFFDHHGFLEVDTPIRQPVYIPESNITPLKSEKEYLQTSPELCMKRLLAAGHSKIFQICHCFRKEEKGRLHLEEFQMLEWYRNGADYYQLMVDCEMLLRFLLINLLELQAEKNFAATSFFSGINLDHTWERLSVADAFARYSPVHLDQALREGQFDEILVEYIEPYLGTVAPVFLYDYPVELGSLARKKADRPTLAERFELYINGIELANGFSELTDADEQRARFNLEIAAIKANTGGDVLMPERFLSDLQQLDTAAGIAMGLDRLFMVIINDQRIADAVTFSPEDFR